MTIKTNPKGGRWNPTPPIPGLTPFTNEPRADLGQYLEANRWISACASTVRAPDLPESLHYTEHDPEWCADLFRDYGVDPEPGPILRKMIAYTQVMEGGEITRAQAAGVMVGMDNAWLLTHEVTTWAWNAPGVELAKTGVASGWVRRVEPDSVDDDIIGWAFALGCHMTWRVDDAMDVDFADKFYWEDELVAVGSDYGWRPEVITERETGLDCSVTTLYGSDGSPAMANYPQGHSFYWMYLLLRAAQVLTGAGVDAMLQNMAYHSGYYRCFAGVHDPESVIGGVQLATALAPASSPLWIKVDNAKELGWPQRAI